MKKVFCAIMVILAILLYSCAKPVEVPTGKGSDVQQHEQQVEAQKPAENKDIPADIQNLLKNSEKIKKVQYFYTGPETGTNNWKFVVEGNRIVYEPVLETKYPYKPEHYDSIVINKEAKTAETYCLGPFCVANGKKSDLKYDANYIKTTLDWVDGITKAEKIGEEVIEQRDTWKISTNNGMLWIDTFYGVPLKVESNGKTYTFKQVKVDAEIPENKLPIDLSSLLNNSVKLKSLQYNYRGPETSDLDWEFFVKGDNIRYVPARKIKTLDRPESFDSIIINRAAQTAVSYCFDATCKTKGKRDDLVYGSTYILTPYDWVTFITTADKLGEQNIENRKTMKIQTNKGIMWIDAFYGVPLQVEYEGELYKFKNVAPNSVEDSEIVIK